MPEITQSPLAAAAEQGGGGSVEQRQNRLIKAGALQTAILTSANFSIIATDEEGIIQLFNVGAERMLGYKAAEVVNRIRPSDIHDPVPPPPKTIEFVAPVLKKNVVETKVIPKIDSVMKAPVAATTNNARALLL